MGNVLDGWDPGQLDGGGRRQELPVLDGLPGANAGPRQALGPPRG